MATEQISKKLARLRSGLRRLIFAVGLLRVLLIGLGVFAAAYILDWYAHLPAATRISAVIAGGGIVLAAVYQHVIRPLAVRLPDDSLALLVEKRHPEFNDRLITAVQLGRSAGGAAAARFNSPSLVRRVVGDATEIAGTTGFAGVLRTAQLKRLVAAGIVCFALAGTYAGLKHDLVKVFLTRMAYPYSDAEWPRKTTLRLPGREKTTYVAKGDDVTVDVLCEGHVPARVALHYRFASTGSGKRRMKRIADREFRAHFPAVAEEFSFKLEGGDHVTGVYEVKVIDRPRVQTIDVAYEFPKYTRLAAYKQTSGQGDVSGVVGTKVSLVAKTNKPIRPGGARIVFDNNASLPMKRAPHRAAPDGGSVLTGEFELTPGPTTYKIEVTDLDGLSNTNPVTYRLRVIVDNPPAVRVVDPKANREVTARATINIAAESSDERDFGGIRETRLVMKNGEEGPELADAFADTTPGSPSVRNRGSWVLARLAPKEGDVITCYVEAEDYNDVTGPGIGRSDAFYLTIISPAQLAAKLDARLKQVKKDVENIRRIQDQLKAKTDDLIDRMRAAHKLSADDERQLGSATQLQKELAKRTTATAGSFLEVAKEMTENEIGAPEDVDRLESFKQALEKIGGEQMPAAAARLAEAQDNDNPTGSLQDASVVQADVLDELGSLLKQLSKTEDLDELIRQAGRLVLKQRGINQRSKNVSIRTLGQTPQEMAEEEKAILRSLERDQSAAHDEMKNLESGMSHFVENMLDKDPAAAEAVRKALEEAARDQIRKTMRDVADKLGEMSPASAVSAEEKIYADLQKLVDNLNEAKRKQYADVEQIKKETEAAARKLEKLIRDQEAQKNASDPGRSKTLESARQRLKRMMKEQEALNKDTDVRAAKREASADLAPRQGSLAKDAQDTAKQLEQLDTKAAEEAGKAAEAMKEAQEILNNNQPATARASQATAMERLKRASELLDKVAQDQKAENLAAEQERIRRETEELTRKLQDLSEQSKSLDTELSERTGAASSSTSKAQQSMGKAGQDLSRDDRKSAGGEQEKAIEHLEEAKRELAEALEELAKKEREKKLFEIGKAIAEMLGKQREVNAETAQIDAVARKEHKLSRMWILKLQQTAARQDELKESAAGVLKKLEAEKSVVFSYAMAEVFRDMSDAARRLAEEETGWTTQQIQKDIERTLSELVEALKQEYEESKQGGGGGGGGGTPGKKLPLVPPLAQLKMLRTLEAKIFDTTKHYEEERTLGRMNPVLLRKRIERLGEKQENVSRIARQFARELDEAQEAAE